MPKKRAAVARAASPPPAAGRPKRAAAANRPDYALMDGLADTVFTLDVAGAFFCRAIAFLLQPAPAGKNACEKVRRHTPHTPPSSPPSSSTHSTEAKAKRAAAATKGSGAADTNTKNGKARLKRNSSLLPRAVERRRRLSRHRMAHAAGKLYQSIDVPAATGPKASVGRNGNGFHNARRKLFAVIAAAQGGRDLVWL